MPKLVAHIVVACAVWFGLGALDAPTVWRLAGIVAGAVGVHLFWERVLFQPHLYLGAMPVRDDDPLMLEAREQAKATLPRFFELFPDHRQDAMVKFGFTNASGTVENLWGDLVEVSDEEATVFVRTPPVECPPDFERRRTIRRDGIVDWQIEMPDGTLRGGYTNRVMFKIFEREQGYMHPKLLPQLARFKDLEDSGEQADA
jgi:hypothetical protein